jgi:hypothetical protein
MPRLLLPLLAAATLAGCAQSPRPDPADAADTSPAARLPLAPGQYAAAFTASRDVLRDAGFVLDRVDAQLGVITTQPKGTGGLLTPWDPEQSGPGEELADAGNRNQRVVRFEFGLPGAAGEPAPGTDLRREPGPLELRASAVVQRLNHAGWRLNTNNVLGSTYALDPQGAERGMVVYTVPVRQDGPLAQWLVDQVRARTGSAQAAAER